MSRICSTRFTVNGKEYACLGDMSGFDAAEATLPPDLKCYCRECTDKPHPERIAELKAARAANVKFRREKKMVGL